MKIGGYQIINLKGKNLTTDVGMVYDGLYELIEGTRKPILLSGIQIDDTEYQDVFAEVSVNGSNIELRAYGKVFTVQDNNVVTVTDDENGGGGGGGDTPEEVRLSIRAALSEDNVYEFDLIAPENVTWREAIILNLIKFDDTYSVEGFINIKIGSTDIVVTKCTPNSDAQSIYLNGAPLYFENNNEYPVTEEDVIQAGHYTNIPIV